VASLVAWPRQAGRQQAGRQGQGRAVGEGCWRLSRGQEGVARPSGWAKDEEEEEGS